MIRDNDHMDPAGPVEVAAMEESELVTRAQSEQQAIFRLIDKLTVTVDNLKRAVAKHDVILEQHFPGDFVRNCRHCGARLFSDKCGKCGKTGVTTI